MSQETFWLDFQSYSRLSYYNRILADIKKMSKKWIDQTVPLSIHIHRLRKSTPFLLVWLLNILIHIQEAALMWFQHAEPEVWIWSFLIDISKSYWNFSDLHILIDHIITTSSFCFLHKSGGLSALCTLLCSKGLPSANSFFAHSFCFNLYSHSSPCRLVSLFISVVLVFLWFNYRGRNEQKKKVSIALLSSRRHKTSLSSSVLFMLFCFFSSCLFFRLFWSWAEELLIHCQMSDIKLSVA